MEEKVLGSRRHQMKGKDFIRASVYSPLIVIQFILTIFFFQNHYNMDAVMYAGYVLWIFSIVFAFSPIFILKRRGGVPKGKGYVHTTQLVTDGLYGIVRHPQYTGGLLLILAMMMVSQHWIVVIAGIVALIVFYYDITKEDEHLTNQFGEQYVEYMKKVPKTGQRKYVTEMQRRSAMPGNE